MIIALVYSVVDSRKLDSQTSQRGVSIVDGKIIEIRGEISIDNIQNIFSALFVLLNGGFNHD